MNQQLARRVELRKEAVSMLARLAMLALPCIVLNPPAASAAELTIGLIPEQNVFLQMKRYKPIGDYIREQTGVSVRFTILSGYGNIITNFTTEKLDGAIWGSFTGALAIQNLGIEPIVRPLWLDGTSTYHGFVFTRKDSGITSVEDMKGKTIAFVDRATTAGYVFPMAYFREHGVTDPDTYFKEYYFAGSHDATIAAVLHRQVDIGCAKNTIFDIAVAKDPSVEKSLVILAESPRVPSNALGMRPDLDPVIKSKLTDALLRMHQKPAGRQVLAKFGAIRFISTAKADYTPVFDVAKRAGIKLKEYRYVNE